MYDKLILDKYVIGYINYFESDNVLEISFNTNEIYRFKEFNIDAYEELAKIKGNKSEHFNSCINGFYEFEPSNQ